ncbi:MAG: hypothetical protein KBT36_05375 [Kurthia sp.]|nr:hypothetical protein [Candidatus Kurthia equi]
MTYKSRRYSETNIYILTIQDDAKKGTAQTKRVIVNVETNPEIENLMDEIFKKIQDMTLATEVTENAILQNHANLTENEDILYEVKKLEAQDQWEITISSKTELITQAKIVTVTKNL